MLDFLYREQQHLADQLRQQMLEIKSREEEAILLEHEQNVLLREKLALEKAVSYNYNVITVFILC